MRSAGCIFNDIVDRDFDKKVQRTKERPIASGKISIVGALIYIILLCSIALLILLQFNLLTILLGMSSMILAFCISLYETHYILASIVFRINI